MGGLRANNLEAADNGINRHLSAMKVSGGHALNEGMNIRYCLRNVFKIIKDGPLVRHSESLVVSVFLYGA
jgi:hypothetical protein